MPLAQGYGYWHGFAFWPWGILVCLAFFVLMLVSMIFIMPRMMSMMGMCGRMEQHKTESEDPLEILRRRYAKGEITDDDFERMRSNLLR